MPRKRKKNYQRTFFKIKEKLVLVPPRKFFGKKILGVVFLVLGSLILSLSLLYFYVLPRFFPKQSQRSVILQEEEFIPQRIIIPQTGLDLEAKEGSLTGKFPTSQGNLKRGVEVLALGDKDYQQYQIQEIEIINSSASGRVFLEDKGLELWLPLGGRATRLMIISAQGQD